MDGNHSEVVGVMLTLAERQRYTAAATLQCGAAPARRVSTSSVESGGIVAAFDVLTSDGAVAGTVLRHYPRRST